MTEGRCDIIIVTWNALETFKKCIKSVQEFTKFQYRLIIVDNDSKPEMLEFLASIPEATVIYNKRNMGFGYANNQGLEAGDSQYVCFLNSDTIVTYEWLTHMISALVYEKAGMVGPVTNFVSSEYQKIEYYGTEDGIQCMAGELYEEHELDSVKVGRLVGFCLVADRFKLSTVGNFDTRFEKGNFEDDDLCYRFTERGYNLYYLPGVFIYHFGGQSFKDNLGPVTNWDILNENKKKFIEKFNPSRLEAVHKGRKRLEILYLLESDTATGGAKVVLEHVNALRSRGHAVVVACRKKVTGMDWFEVKTPIFYGELDNLPQVDVVVGTYFTTLKYVAASNIKAKVHLSQGYEGFLHEHPGVLEQIKEAYKSVPNKMVISSHLKNTIEEEYGFDCFYINVGYDHDIFGCYKKSPECFREEIPRILITGTDVLTIKGIPDAIEAVRKMVEMGHIKVVRISSHESVDYGFEHEHHCMPEMSQQEIADVYNSCDITICSCWKVEGFSLPALESMACGTPVITTDNGGVTDYGIDGENCFLVPAKNSEAIKEKIKKLLADTPLRKKFIENGLETAEQYKWPRKMDQVEDLFYYLVGTNNK